MNLRKLILLGLSSLAIAPAPPGNNALQTHTIRAAYEVLGGDVSRTIRLQLGDISRIEQQQSSATDFLESIHQVCTTINSSVLIRVLLSC